MNIEEQDSLNNYFEHYKLVAAILFLIQILLFFLYYNFEVDILVLGMGWILLFPGLILVLLSTRDQESQPSTSRSRNMKVKWVSSYTMHFGWSIVSISLALIIQQWFTYFIALGFIFTMILDSRRIRKGKENVSLVNV